MFPLIPFPKKRGVFRFSFAVSWHGEQFPLIPFPKKRGAVSVIAVASQMRISVSINSVSEETGSYRTRGLGGFLPPFPLIPFPKKRGEG